MASVCLDAPVVGALMEVPAGELLQQATDMAEDAARAELDAWVAHREVAIATAVDRGEGVDGDAVIDEILA